MRTFYSQNCAYTEKKLCVSNAIKFAKQVKFIFLPPKINVQSQIINYCPNYVRLRSCVNYENLWST